MFLSPTIRPVLALVLAAMLAPPSPAAELPGPYRAFVERVVDGDTLAVRATIWLGQEVRVLVRLRGVDAPELRAACARERAMAKASKAALAELLGEGAVTLSSIDADKYGGRVVADVARADGADLAALLLAAGHARPYGGGSRAPWCVARAKLEDPR